MKIINSLRQKFEERRMQEGENIAQYIILMKGECNMAEEN